MRKARRRQPLRSHWATAACCTRQPRHRVELPTESTAPDRTGRKSPQRHAVPSFESASFAPLQLTALNQRQQRQKRQQKRCQHRDPRQDGRPHTTDEIGNRRVFHRSTSTEPALPTPANSILALASRGIGSFPIRRGRLCCVAGADSWTKSFGAHCPSQWHVT